jgi:hypothetical protein
MGKKAKAKPAKPAIPVAAYLISEGKGALLKMKKPNAIPPAK